MRALVVALLCAGCRTHDAAEHEHTHDIKHSDDARGPHGGRLFGEASLLLEVGIVDIGESARLRVYPSSEGKAIPPGDVSVSIKLSRLGGRDDTFTCEPAEGYLVSPHDIAEPHSFDVSIEAQYRGATYRWSYSSYEGRTEIPEREAAASGISVEKAGPQIIKNSIRIRGRIVPSEHRIAHVIPRFAGVVREGRKHIGDSVTKGEVMAVVESNQSLQPFELRAQISGTVVQGHLIVGEYVAENQWVYVIADLSEVWADFYLPLTDRDSVHVGQIVEVRSPHSQHGVSGPVVYIAPYADERTQAQLVRVSLENSTGAFVPGMFVTGDLIVSETSVPTAVRTEALQGLHTWRVVFRRVGDIYEAQPVTVGRSNEEWSEVSAGLAPGDEYVTRNSFIVKADILKAGASHDH